jgi:LysR family transcriptional regulator for metE and metH
MLRDELVLLTPPRHPLSARRFVTAKDFVDVHLLTYDVPPDHLDLFCRVLRPARVHPRKVQRVPLTEAILEMVKAGIGVAVHPRWIAAPDLEAGRLRAVRITRGGMKRTWSLAARWPGPPLLHAFARDLAGYGCRGMDCGASK